MIPDTPQLPVACARRYRVERVLASGGFGTVVLAQQVDLERPVAIKLLHHDVLRRADEVERFRAEARITALLEHPHVVRVYDHGVDDGVPWIAFEYLPGRSLAAAIQERPLAPPEALTIGAQVASALEAGHARGVLHRDVKPANVMEAGEACWKVTDFGIARWTAGSGVHTKTGVLLGTPAYISPEQVQGEPASPASDLYALGVLLFELLTGRTPFAAENLGSLLALHVKEPPPPPSRLRPAVPAAVDELVIRLLSKDPARRAPPAGTLADELERLSAEKGGYRVFGRHPRPAGDTAPVSRPQETRSLTTAAVAPAPERGAARRVIAALVCCVALAAGTWLAFRPRPGAGARPRPASPSASAVPEPREPDPKRYSRDGAEGIYLRALTFRMGSERKAPTGVAEDGPPHEVHVGHFYMDRYEVTIARFRRFVKERGYRTLAEVKGWSYASDTDVGGLSWSQPRPLGVASELEPVVHLTWAEARAFCRWAGGDLPTEAQWERAAGGGRGRDFPWGNDDRRPKVNLRVHKGYPGLLDDMGFAAAVNAPRCSADMTPEGLRGMVGNASEWCFDWSWSGYARTDVSARRLVDPTGPPGPDPRSKPPKRVTRGGSFLSSPFDGMVFRRRSREPDLPSNVHGCRCVYPVEGALPQASLE